MFLLAAASRIARQPSGHDFSVGAACCISAVTPHDLRHRRISLLHLRGVPWARIADFVGQRDLSVTANTYTHVLVNEAEVDYGKLLA
jgi:integrase